MALLDALGPIASVGRSLLQSSRALDVVAITGAGFAPMFAQARPLAASVYETSDLMEHPLEDGSKIADHIVRNPVEIELPLLCIGETVYRSTFASIRATYIAGTLLTVLTRAGSYPNMVITDLPHEETPDIFNGIAINLRLREARFVTPSSGGLSQAQTADAKQSSTVQRGAQQTTPATSSSTSAAASSYQSSGAGPAPQGSTLYRWAYQ